MINNRLLLTLTALWTALAVLSPRPSAAIETSGALAVFNVRDFGVRGNGATLETGRIQKAIEACAAAGGGRVVFPRGRYASTTLFLKNGVTLHFEKGAVLSASRELADYPHVTAEFRSRTDHYTRHSLIYGEGLDNIGITGEGTLDGNGEAFLGPQLERPYLIRLVSCRKVSVTGITLRDAAMWAQHYLACDDLKIDSVKVRSHRQLNNDGLDLDGCQRVTISNCDIRTEDDAIVLKSTSNRPCRDVQISHCILSSDNNALKLGTESCAGFENISIHDCTIYDTKNSGLALELVDGGKLDGVDVSRLRMDNVGAPIFIRLGNRGRPALPGAPKAGVGSLQNIRIRDVVATGASRIGCSITGLADAPAKNISLENIRITFKGGTGESGFRRTVAEHAGKYPEHSMFGVLPAYGFYCRHVRNLSFKNIELDFQSSDRRPSLICDDITGLRLRGWSGLSLDGTAQPYRFLNVNDVQLESVSTRPIGKSPDIKPLPAGNKAG